MLKWPHIIICASMTLSLVSCSSCQFTKSSNHYQSSEYLQNKPLNKWTQNDISILVEESRAEVKYESILANTEPNYNPYVGVFGTNDVMICYWALINFLEAPAVPCSVQKEIMVMEAFIEVHPTAYFMILDRLCETKQWLKTHTTSNDLSSN